ncbi:MAG: hypothetical protein NTU49_00020, partial [Gammaproteobacteria bacterium]|nr:hypothetical protein [Gammaproteobacteria bacterium]
KNDFVKADSIVFKDFWSLVRYGAPFVAGSALIMVSGNVDRFVLNLYVSAEELATYLVLAKVAGAMSFAMAPINLWWPVARNEHSLAPDGGKIFFENVYSLILFYYLTIAISIFVLADFIFPMLMKGLKFDSPMLFVILLYAWIAQAMCSVMNSGLLTPGKTYWVIAVSAVSAVGGIFFSYLFIPSQLVYGAAMSVMLAQSLALIVNVYVSQRIQFVSIQYLKMFAILLFASFIFYVLSKIELIYYRGVIILLFVGFAYPFFRSNLRYLKPQASK